MLISILNPSNISFCDKAYEVTIGVHRSFHGVVIADCAQEALDLVIDHFEDNEDKNPAFFLSDEQYNELDEVEKDEFLQGGNHGRYLSFATSELFMKEVSTDIQKETLYIEVK